MALEEDLGHGIEPLRGPRRDIACVAAFVMVVATCLPGTAWAWGADGHRLVAEYAHARLSPSVRARVEELLALEQGATLSSVATWADEVRSPTTATWHYLNFARQGDCQYDADRMCPRGNCVVGAIERQLSVLASGAPGERRLTALKYVVHFVADVHQPLHAGFGGDRGGNSFQLQAFGRGTNLHALWDSALIQHWPGGLDALRQAMDKAPEADGVDPRKWAEESCRTVSAEHFYPPRHKLDEDYLLRWQDQVPRQLAAAGRRLVRVLEMALAGR